MNNNSNIDLNKVSQDINKLNRFIEQVEQLGGELPNLKKAVKYLELAVNTGEDLVNACNETSKAFREVDNELHKSCGDDYACQARIDRLWQARAVNWTLSWENENSVISIFIRNIICRYLPKKLSGRLDYCEGVQTN